MRANRGSILIFALMLTVMTTLIGLSLLGMKKGHYSASQVAVRGVQARLLAHSGIHDAIAKLSKDPFFPSGVGDAQSYFTYRENLRNQLGEVIGTYEVSVDQGFRKEKGLVVITSTGQTLGGTEKISRHATYVELEISPTAYQVRLWKEGAPPSNL